MIQLRAGEPTCGPGRSAGGQVFVVDLHDSMLSGSTSRSPQKLLRRSSGLVKRRRALARLQPMMREALPLAADWSRRGRDGRYTRLFGSRSATISTTFLLVVLVVAAVSTFRVAVAVSVVAVLAFNYFFLPPVGTFTIADPQNWVALFAFLAVSLVASNLSAVARARDRRSPRPPRRAGAAVRPQPRRADHHRRPRRDQQRWRARSRAGSISPMWPSRCRSRRDVGAVRGRAARRSRSTSRSCRWRSPARRRASSSTPTSAPIRAIARPWPASTRSGWCRCASAPSRSACWPRPGAPVEPGTLDALAAVVAIAIERASLLDERKAAEIARRGEELKTALLASLAHDLRTPLTAIRVAASNLQSAAARRRAAARAERR